MTGTGSVCSSARISTPLRSSVNAHSEGGAGRHRVAAGTRTPWMGLWPPEPFCEGNANTIRLARA